MEHPIKTTADVGVTGTALVGYLGAIPWPTVAAFLSSIYIALRILELFVGWGKKKD